MNKNLTCGEIMNMRRRLDAARKAFGDIPEPGFSASFVNDGRRKPELTPREQAVLDIARILDRILD